MRTRRWWLVVWMMSAWASQSLCQVQEILVFEGTKEARFELPDRLPCAVWDGSNRPWCLLREIGAGGTDLVLTRQREEVARLANCRRGAIVALPRFGRVDVLWESEDGAAFRTIHRRSFSTAAKKWLGAGEVVTAGAGVQLDAVALAGDLAIVVMTRRGAQSVAMHIRADGAEWQGPIPVVERTVVASVALAASQEHIVAAYTTEDGLCFVRHFALATNRFEDAVGVPVGTDRPFRCRRGDAIELATWRDLVYLTIVDRVGGARSDHAFLCSRCFADQAWVAHDLGADWQAESVRLAIEGSGRVRVLGLHRNKQLVLATGTPSGVEMQSVLVSRAVDGFGIGFISDNEIAVVTSSVPPSRSPLRAHALRLAGQSARGRAAMRRGPTEEAVVAALDWLARHQDEDGKWDCDSFMKHDAVGEVCNGPGNAMHDVGVTGLAVLCFLNDGGRFDVDPHREVLRNAVRWLVDQQRENGLVGASHNPGGLVPRLDWGTTFIYDHAIAAQALVRAYGVAKTASLREPAERALGYLEQHRNPYSVWRYLPRDNDNDTSVTSWCGAACVWAGHHGLQVNQEALKLLAVWLDQVSDPSGLHGYSKQGEPSDRLPGEHATRFPPEKGAAMTAAGLWCRVLLRQNPEEKPVMKAAADLIRAKPPVWDERGGSIDFYYWYFATHALFQMGGAYWNDWKKKLEIAVVKNQRRDKANKNLFGSWDPVDVWGEQGGRVYGTAILCLALQTEGALPGK